MPTIVLDAAQCDLRQSGAPTALLRDCTIVLVWPVTGSYSTARPNYSVRKSYRMWEGAPVSAWLPILTSQGSVGVAAAVSSFRCPLSSYVFFLSVIIGRVFVCRKFDNTLHVECRWRVQ
jgi:hypothetical protein